jgi:type I restriction enzyme S subunit
VSALPVVKLDEVCLIQRGGSPRPIDQYMTDDLEGINWIKIGDVVQGAKYIHATQERIKPEGAKRSREVAYGDFLLSNSMSFGRPYILRTSGCIHDGWLVLRYDKQKLTEDYLYHVLSSDAVYAQFVKLAVGAVVKNLNSEVVRQVRIPLPPVSEQRRIAAILDQADALRAQRREALAQLGSLTQAIFIEMFGDPVSNPMAWPVVPSGELAQVQGGLQVTSARKDLPVEAPYLRVANVYRGFLDLSEIKTIQATAAEIARTLLCANDVLVVEGHGNPNEIGRSALWTGQIADCVHQNHLIRVRFDADKVVPAYACEYLNSPGGRQHLLRAGKTTTGLNTISVSNVRAAPIALPPLALQQTFANRIQAVQALQTTHRTALAELDALFASLQHRAFSGAL